MQTKLIFLSSSKVINMEAWSSDITWGKLAAMWSVGKVALTLFQSRSSQPQIGHKDLKDLGPVQVQSQPGRPGTPALQK